MTNSGLSTLGRMSVDIRRPESTPKRRIRTPMTPMVYLYRRAKRTIHMAGENDDRRGRTQAELERLGGSQQSGVRFRTQPGRRKKCLGPTCAGDSLSKCRPLPRALGGALAGCRRTPRSGAFSRIPSDPGFGTELLPADGRARSVPPRRDPRWSARP